MPEEGLPKGRLLEKPAYCLANKGHLLQPPYIALVVWVQQAGGPLAERSINATVNPEEAPMGKRKAEQQPEQEKRVLIEEVGLAFWLKVRHIGVVSLGLLILTGVERGGGAGR